MTRDCVTTVCGCEYLGGVIYYCPLHIEAGNMLKLLKWWRGSPGINWQMFIEEVDAVIARAEVKDGQD